MKLDIKLTSATGGDSVKRIINKYRAYDFEEDLSLFTLTIYKELCDIVSHNSLLQGNMRSKIFIITTLSLLVIASVLTPIIYIVEYIGLNWIYFVVCPILFLSSVLFWLNKVTSIKRNACGKNYGISVGLDGWPSVPEVCASCKVKC
jgi:hypothetical protein